MPIRKIVPILITISILSLSSCVENNRSLGEQFITDDYILKIDTASFDLPVTNRITDTIQGVSYERILLGYIADPIYGVTTMSGASLLVPLSDSTYLGVEPKLKDVYLSLVIDSTTFFDPSQEGIPQNLYVYEMTTEMDSTMIFNNSITPDKYNPVPISTGSPIIFGESTIKINLTEEFGNKLLSTTKEEFEDYNLFIKKINGLYITTDTPENVVEGGRLNFAPFSKSAVYVDYVLNDPERNFVDKDTTETFLFGYAFALNQFTPGSNHLATDNPTDTIYLEGLSGVKPHVSAKEIKGILDRWMEALSREKGIPNIKNAIVLSRASLIFPYEMPQDYERFDIEHPSAIFPFSNIPWATDSLRFMKAVDDINRVSSPGAVNRGRQEYVCDITSFMQDMIAMEDEEVDASLDMWISPLYFYSSESGYSYYTLDISGFNRVFLNGPSKSRRPKLKLTYTLFLN